MYAYRERLELENGARACTAFENVAGQAKTKSAPVSFEFIAIYAPP